MAHDLVAQRGVAIGAARDDVLSAKRGDRAFDPDVEIIDREIQSGDEGRRISRANRRRRADFGVERRIAAAEGYDLIGRLGDRIGDVRLRRRAGVVEFGQAARPDIARPRHTKQQIVIDTVGRAELPRPDAAGVAVMAVTGGAAELDVAEILLQQRDCDFGEAFLDVEAAVDLRKVEGREGLRPRQIVKAARSDRLPARFGTNCD